MKGGETPLACSRTIYQMLTPKITDLFERHDGVKYIKFLLNKASRLVRIKEGNVAFMTWQDLFQTTDPAEVDRLCAEQGMETRWNRFGGLQTVTHLPAVTNHPLTGEKLWFNQVNTFNPTRGILSFAEYIGYNVLKLLFAPKRFTFACFGDDMPIPTRVIEYINNVTECATVKFPWQKGDVMYLDNYRLTHGRMSFEGQRRVLAGLK